MILDYNKIAESPHGWENIGEMEVESRSTSEKVSALIRRKIKTKLDDQEIFKAFLISDSQKGDKPLAIYH